jgi:FHA domain
MGGGEDGGDRPEAKGAEELKTRFIPRTDVIDRSAPALPGSASPTPSGIAAPAGTVIGRTRLVGDHGQAMQGSGEPVTPAPAMGQATGQAMGQAMEQAMGEAMEQAKTELVRSETCDGESVAGWVVVVDGPGRGGYRAVYAGMNSVGRDPNQRVCLNFGDETISPEQHAFITYDEEQRLFFLQHGGKSNLVRLGGQPVLSPVQLSANGLIRIGRTTLRFIPCCGPNFSWGDEVAEA